MHYRSSHCSTVYTSISTYIYFIFQNNNSDLRNLIVSIRSGSKTKSVSSNHCTRVQDTFVTYAAIMINIYIGVQQATVAYLHAVSNKSVWINLGIISNHGIFTNIGKCTDVYVLTNFGAGCNES